MGWSYGYVNGRDVGYGVPAECDAPDCVEEIDRGLYYVCGSDPGGGDHGCGLFFCDSHLRHGVELEDDCAPQLCEVCYLNYRLDCIDPVGAWQSHAMPYDPKPDVAQWLRWKLRDVSWCKWRTDNPDKVDEIRQQLHEYAEAKR